jgi:hypothetical protein
VNASVGLSKTEACRPTRPARIDVPCRPGRQEQPHSGKDWLRRTLLATKSPDYWATIWPDGRSKHHDDHRECIWLDTAAIGPWADEFTTKATGLTTRTAERTNTMPDNRMKLTAPAQAPKRGSLCGCWAGEI